MYHVELRQFPHNFCRFNLTESELRKSILDAWAQGEWIEFGERKWNPHQAKLTVLQGPELALEQLTMGRGWRAAVREGQDVTEQLLAAVESPTGPIGPTGVDAHSGIGRASALDQATAETQARDVRLLADSLGLELLSQIGNEPVALVSVWQLARQRYPTWSASESLKLAEHAVRSLTGSRLAVVLLAAEAGEPPGGPIEESKPCASTEEIDEVLASIDSWSSPARSASASIRRA